MGIFKGKTESNVRAFSVGHEGVPGSHENPHRVYVDIATQEMKRQGLTELTSSFLEKALAYKGTGWYYVLTTQTSPTGDLVECTKSGNLLKAIGALRDREESEASFLSRIPQVDLAKLKRELEEFEAKKREREERRRIAQEELAEQRRQAVSDDPGGIPGPIFEQYAGLYERQAIMQRRPPELAALDASAAEQRLREKEKQTEKERQVFIMAKAILEANGAGNEIKFKGLTITRDVKDTYLRSEEEIKIVRDVRVAGETGQYHQELLYHATSWANQQSSSDVTVVYCNNINQWFWMLERQIKSKRVPSS